MLAVPLVVIGVLLDGFGLYEPLIDFAGAGATVPITSFGNSLVHGAMQEAEKHGLVGVLTGMFEVTSSGISAAIVFGMIGALIFKPKRIRRIRMTVGSDVKQCFASLRGVEASLSSLALRTLDDESKRTLHEAMMVVHEVTKDLKKRVGELEGEELQYKGF